MKGELVGPNPTSTHADRLRTLGSVAVELAHDAIYFARMKAGLGYVPTEELPAWRDKIPHVAFDGFDTTTAEAEDELKRGSFFSIDIQGATVKKLGRTESPLYGYYSPSDERFPSWYGTGVEIQTQAFADLSHLVLPQEVGYESIGRESRTFIEQPRVNYLQNLKDLTLEDLYRLYDELGIFEKESWRMRSDAGLLPDLTGDFIGDVRGHVAKYFLRNSGEARTNLVVAPYPNGPHYTLLDNGVSDRSLPAPAFNELFDQFFKARIGLEKVRLTTAIRRRERKGFDVQPHWR